MNELVAPIYYAFCAELEADAGMREVVADFFQGLKDEEAGESEAGTDEAQTSATSSDAEVAFRGSFIKGRSLCGVSIAQSALQAVEADAFFCFTALMSEVRARTSIPMAMDCWGMSPRCPLALVCTPLALQASGTQSVFSAHCLP